MIVFLHGYTGHPESTWQLFPELLRTGGLGVGVDFEIASFGYETSGVFNFRSIQTISELLLTYVDTHADTASDVFIVAHSLGGVVARDFLLRCHRDQKRRRFFSKVRQAHMIGTPQRPVWFPFSRILFLNKIVQQLARRSTYISDLMKTYRTEVYRDGRAFDEAVPAIFNYVGDDDWVTPYNESHDLMRPYEPIRVVPADHVSSAKPHSQTEPIYELITREIRAACFPKVVSPHLRDLSSTLHPYAIRAARSTPDRWMQSDRILAGELLALGDNALTVLLGLVTLEAHQQPIGNDALALWTGLPVESGLLALAALQKARLVVQEEPGLTLAAGLFSQLSGLFYSSSDTPGLPLEYRIRHLRERLEAVHLCTS